MERPCPHCAGSGKIQLSALAQLLEARGMKQGAAAKILSLSQSAFSRLLARGDNWFYSLRRGTRSRLDDLAKALGVTRGQLTGQEPLPAPKAPRPHRAPPPGAVAASRRHRASVKAKNKAKAKARRA